MNRREDFNRYRELYSTFIYKSYSYEIEDDLKITYHFEIPGLKEFFPEIRIPKKNIKIDYQKEVLEELIFHIGLIELISYIKCTCSKTIVIEAGYLSKEQSSFFQKLYYYGLGEFLYRNGIEIEQEELFEFVCTKEKKSLPSNNYHGSGNLICVGGGKDSCVSLELLKEEENTCFMMNPKTPAIECSKVAGYSLDDCICAYRKLDYGIIELNEAGYLNGHTPLSSLIAFLSYLCCYLSGKKNIVLSNEASANQPTIPGTKINHQYSKTLEFENDFREYMNNTIGLDIHYFSLLRGLSEYNIAKIFSHYPKYFSIFKSCNLGSKEKEWVWCCNCPKCLFIYTILAPFIEKEERIKIFGEDLFDRRDFLDLMLDMVGYSDAKPFECVGTFEEARLAISQVIQKGEKGYLLDYYQNHFPLELDDSKIIAYQYCDNLGIYNTLVEKELKKYD